MNNDKRVAFQEHRIEELEKQNRDLISENNAISKENEKNKKLLALKDKELSYLRESVLQMRVEHHKSLEQTRRLSEDLKNAIDAANAAKKELEKKSRNLLNRLRRYK